MKAVEHARRREQPDQLITTPGGWRVPRTLSTDPVLNLRLRRLAALEQAPHRVRVNFAIVGVQKAGTSTLYRMLVQHPEVAGGPEKEMRLFMDESRDWDHPDYAEFARPAAG